jgi:hypothetical protein
MPLLMDRGSPRQNHLLEVLPAADYGRLLPHLQRVLMPLGDIIYESGDEMRYVYFPTTCIVSVLYCDQMGASTEVAMVGNEGLVGIALFMGGRTMPNRGVVQSAGHAYRLPRSILQQEFDRCGAL